MQIERIETRRVELPLVRPFVTSFGRQTTRDGILVRVVTAESDGWGECVTPAAPVYSAEYTDGALHVMEHHLIPRLLSAGDLTGAGVREVFRPIVGHPFAKAALEMAVLDAELRSKEVSLASHLGAVRDRVPCGVSVGIPDGGLDELLAQVGGYLEDGYLRIKLKIQPGFDLEPVRAVREAFPHIMLQVDANAAYTLDDAEHLRLLDAFGLTLIEQPLPEDHLLAHAELASKLATPICLDESITSAVVARDALELGACSVVNIKIGRVGGLVEAKDIHDLCLDRGVPVWCGGMLETGLGRAANVALAALPGFTLPGDTSASDRYFSRDVTSPFVLQDGHLDVPDGNGLGVHPEADVLNRITTERAVYRR